MQDNANTNALGLVAENTGQYAMNPSDLTNFTLEQGAQGVAGLNQANQSMLGSQEGVYQNFGNTVNSMAGQLQSTANADAAAQNQANAANLSFMGGLASAGMAAGVAA